MIQQETSKTTLGKGQGQKAGKKRGSAQARAYLAQNRAQINARIQQARHSTAVAVASTRVLSVPRGTARNSRRIPKQQAYDAQYA